jgi:ribosomal protein S9
MTLAINKDGTENTKGVETLGLPYYAATYIVGKTGVSLAVTSAITSALLWNWEETKAAFRKADDPATEDPHRTITKKYAQFPEW